MQDTYDPFSFLLSEIHAYDVGLRGNWDPYQRQHYLDVLLADEAEEIAWGRRHLPIVHGELVDEVEAEVLDDIFDAWSDIANRADWSRVGGVPDHHLTLTLAASNTTELLAVAADLAARASPGHWHIIVTAISDRS